MSYSTTDVADSDNLLLGLEAVGADSLSHPPNSAALSSFHNVPQLSSTLTFGQSQMQFDQFPLPLPGMAMFAAPVTTSTNQPAPSTAGLHDQDQTTTSITWYNKSKAGGQKPVCQTVHPDGTMCLSELKGKGGSAYYCQAGCLNKNGTGALVWNVRMDANTNNILYSVSGQKAEGGGVRKNSISTGYRCGRCGLPKRGHQCVAQQDLPNGLSGDEFMNMDDIHQMYADDDGEDNDDLFASFMASSASNASQPQGSSLLVGLAPRMVKHDNGSDQNWALLTSIGLMNTFEPSPKNVMQDHLLRIIQFQVLKDTGFDHSMHMQTPSAFLSAPRGTDETLEFTIKLLKINCCVWSQPNLNDPGYKHKLIVYTDDAAGGSVDVRQMTAAQIGKSTAPTIHIGFDGVCYNAYIQSGPMQMPASGLYNMLKEAPPPMPDPTITARVGEWVCFEEHYFTPPNTYPTLAFDYRDLFANMFEFARTRANQVSCNTILCYMVRSATPDKHHAPNDPALQIVNGTTYTGYSTWRIELYQTNGRVTADHLVHFPCTRFFVRNDAVQKHAERMVDIASFRARAATYFAV